MKLLLLVALTFTISSCQHRSQYKSGHENFNRTFASTQAFSNFIRKIAAQSGKSIDTLEDTIIRYIRSSQQNSTHGNWTALGITEDQAKQIKSLSDDHPFMGKVRKWVSENVTTAAKVKPLVADEAFEEFINGSKNGSRGVINPYRRLNQESVAQRAARHKGSSPFSSIAKKQDIVLREIEDLPRDIQKVYRKNLAEFQKRGQDSPSVHANGQEIVQSANLISKKTGLKAMGEGCEEFTKNASSEVLAIKADVDIRRAEIIEEMAHAKAGRSFASVDDIPASQRLDETDLQYATEKAFQDVLGYTDDEASRAIKRLKSKPCKLY